MSRETLRLAVTIPFVFLTIVMYQRWEEFAEERTAPATGAQGAPAEQARQGASAAADDSGELPQVTQQLSLAPSDVPISSADADLPTPAAATEDPAASSAALTLRNDAVVALFDARGNVIELDLLRHAVKLEGDPLPLLYTQPGARFNIQTGLIGEGLPTHKDSGWQVEGLSATEMKSTWQSGSLSVVREYVLAPEGYLATVAFAVTNNGDEPVNAHAYFQLIRDTGAPASYSALLPSFYGAVTYTESDKYAKYDFDDLEDYPRASNDGWIGIVQRYFLTAWLDGGSARENFMRNLPSGDIAIGAIRPLGSIAPGATHFAVQPLFAGALEQNLLSDVPEDVGPRLDLAVDYGWLTLLCQPLFSLLSYIERFVGNWGLAIVMLTLMVKLAFYPLSSASYRSMAKMKAYAPKIKELKERHGKDREAFQRSMLELYRKEKINPLGGCLPILVQIPVFIALYWVILGSIELRHEPLALWVHDLSAPDGLYILPVLLGMVMMLQMRLNPTPPDPTQAMIMKIMPIGFAAFSIFFPAGLVVYWIANTGLSILQQWAVMRSVAKPVGKRGK